MAAEVEIEVGNRTVRISNPDREYFPARGETKLDLSRCYLSRGDGLLSSRPGESGSWGRAGGRSTPGAPVWSWRAGSSRDGVALTWGGPRGLAPGRWSVARLAT